MSHAQTLLLAHSRDAERLAGKAGGQDVVDRNRTGIQISDIRVVHRPPVGFVGTPRKPIDLDRIHAGAAGEFQCGPDSADPCKEVNKPETKSQ
jgi:hypothetical protein